MKQKSISLCMTMMLLVLSLNGEKISLPRSQFLVTIARLIPDYKHSRRWENFIKMLEEHEANKQIITSSAKLNQLRNEIVTWQEKDKTKKSRIYKILSIALDVIDGYKAKKSSNVQSTKNKLTCLICFDTFKKIGPEKNKNNYLVKMPCSQTFCYDCLRSHYARHDSHNTKGDGYRKCPGCRSDQREKYTLLFGRDFVFKKLQEHYVKEKNRERKEQEKQDQEVAQRIYEEQLQNLQDYSSDTSDLFDSGDESQEF